MTKRKIFTNNFTSKIAYFIQLYALGFCNTVYICMRCCKSFYILFSACWCILYVFMNPIPARWGKILNYISIKIQIQLPGYIINADQYTSYSNKVFKHFLSQQINYKVFLKHEICFQLRRVKGKSYINRRGLQCYICLENEFHLINKQNSTTFVLALNEFLSFMKGADINGNNFTK